MTATESCRSDSKTPKIGTACDRNLSSLFLCLPKERTDKAYLAHLPASRLQETTW